MDKRELRERKRRKQQQIRRRKMIRLGTYALAVLLVLLFVIRGVILPIANKIGGSKTPEETEQVQEEAVETDENAAVRIPLKNQNNLSKASQLTAGWHEDADGKWYQNTDGTYFAGGMQEIDGSTYYFDENGHIQTGWVSIGFDDYYFDDNGVYDETQHKPMIALTFDDGPGDYTSTLLDALEANNAHATFFMLGQLVGSYPEVVQRMVNIGCEIGSHSYDHSDLANLDIDSVAEQFTKTDEALVSACGQAATVARAPYGDWTNDIISAVGKPFFMWSIDSLDWSYLDVNKDYDAVMNNENLKDGTVVLMHDIHEPSVEAAVKMIPDLIAKGFKLVTVSELAEAKGVTLQNASYSDFWDTSLEQGLVAGYEGNTETSEDGSEENSEEDSSDSSEESDGSEDDYSEDDYSEEDSGDGSYDDSYDDGSYEDSEE